MCKDSTGPDGRKTVSRYDSQPANEKYYTTPEHLKIFPLSSLFPLLQGR